MILRTLTSHIDAWTANGIRYPFAAMLYWPLLYWAFQTGRLNLALVRRCLIPTACSLGGQVFWALSFYELPASEVGFLIRLSSVWTVVASMVLFRDERQLLKRSSFYFGVSLIALGFLAMSWFREPGATTGPDVPPGNYQLGIFYILLCGAFFGFYLVSVRKCVPDVNPMVSFGIVANLVSVGTVAGMLLLGDVTLVGKQTAYSWSLLLGSAFLGIALGHVMLFVAVQRLGASITSVCQTLMPFVTATAATFLLSETLTRYQWISGAVMVVGAIVLLSIKNEITRAPSEGIDGT